MYTVNQFAVWHTDAFRYAHPSKFWSSAIYDNILVPTFLQPTQLFRGNEVFVHSARPFRRTPLHGTLTPLNKMYPA